MMNRPTNQSGAGAELELRLRTLRILWGAFLMTIGLYALITVFALPPRDALEEGRDNPTLLLAFAVIGLMSVAVSFMLKRHFYGHAVERGEPARVEIGLIHALAVWARFRRCSA